MSPSSLSPFLIIWGLILLPTFLVWAAFILAVYTLTRSRYATYGIGLARALLQRLHRHRRRGHLGH